MIVVALAAGILAFVAVLHFGRAVPLAREAAQVAGEAAAVMRAPDLGDDEKERRTRRAAVRLFGSFAAISLISLAALGAAAAVVWLGAVAGFYGLGEAVHTASSWPFILISSAAMIAVWLTVRYAPRRTQKLDA